MTIGVITMVMAAAPIVGIAFGLMETWLDWRVRPFAKTCSALWLIGILAHDLITTQSGSGVIKGMEFLLVGLPIAALFWVPFLTVGLLVAFLRWVRSDAT
jgi:hypothetical protein